MKVNKKEEEKKIKARMSERAYMQRQLSQKKDYVKTVEFSLKFMLISMPLSFAIFLLFSFIAFSVLMVVCCVISGFATVATFAWLFTWKISKKPKVKQEIGNLEERLAEFRQEDTDKYLKIAEQLKKQSQSKQ